MINDRGVKLQNSITLLIVNTIYLTVNYDIIPESTTFAIYEIGII